jgi:hypothetical protein
MFLFLEKRVSKAKKENVAILERKALKVKRAIKATEELTLLAQKVTKAIKGMLAHKVNVDLLGLEDLKVMKASEV